MMKLREPLDRRMKLSGRNNMCHPFSYRTKRTETITTSSDYGSFIQSDTKVSISAELKQLMFWIDRNKKKFVEDLSEMVSVKSISSHPKYKNEVLMMGKIVGRWLRDLGVKFQYCNIPRCKNEEGKLVDVPPAILGTLGTDKNKYTVCLYSYLDISDIPKPDTKSFELYEENNSLYGRGTAANKGPLLTWFHAIQGLQELDLDLPVNIKFILESTNKIGSLGLEEFLKPHRSGFLKDVDLMVVCDGEWVHDTIPSLVYGAAGMCVFRATVSKRGISAGSPHSDLAALTEDAVDDQGRINIDEFYEDVEQVTPEEEELLSSVEFDTNSVTLSLPPYMENWPKLKLLLRFWREPTMMMSEIKACNCDDETVDITNANIVQREFAVKIVPKQLPETVAPRVIKYFKQLCKERDIKNNVRVEMVASSRPWMQDYKDVHYEAARRALLQVYKDEPSMIRDDGDLPTVLLLQRVIDVKTLVLPMVNCLANPDTERENISIRNYVEGTKVICALLYQIAQIDPNCLC